MKEGDVVLTPVPQADGKIKNRPSLLLRTLPPYDDALVCGISTQLQRKVAGFDEIVQHQDADFSASGLIVDSVVRLGFLAVIPRKRIIGSIGAIAPSRHLRLLKNLSEHLLKR